VSAGRTALANDDPALLAFWHPVAAADGPRPDTVELCGRHLALADCAGVVEHIGLVWAAPEPPTAPLPEVPDDADGRFVRVPSPPRRWRTGAGVMADNFCDLGHLPFVHADSFADPDDTGVPALVVSRSDTGFEVVHHHTTRRLHGDGVGRRVFRLSVTAPFAVVLRLEYRDDDAVITSAFCHQPVDRHHTVLWAVNWRDDVLDGRATVADTTRFQELVGAEDRAVLERLRDPTLPLDLTVEVHTRADRPTVELRRLLARALAPVAD
jgi:phenylpropionate dioxygenase-like ring-hydroxylating dioxygenase large terminal subunit